ncbi:MAG: endonuclease/exonuclease/phosphatase family protein [Candidatus Accumulibacter sp.]|jgi:endonuclease/exonuclease/phosphatase family metal-dependent hydrolase|nr:endonuclease/exonuclease/phosphatase family protein [Accumulibacter sp.]
MKTRALRIVTYNIHKGFSQFNRHLMVYELREQLRLLDADIVFLQEVQGKHSRHAERIENWPEEPQHTFLAGEVWQSTVYASNAMYDHGHHGNAILSRFPIAHAFNQDVTHLRFERRGLLHCRIEIPDSLIPAHCVCVHLSLFARSRQRQMDALATYLEDIAEHDAPLIVAGDFNDWSNEADIRLAQRLDLNEIFSGMTGTPGVPARSFPARRPVLRLDRIYVRGFSVKYAKAHSGKPWSKLSDHAALSAQLILRAEKTVHGQSPDAMALTGAIRQVTNGKNQGA